MITCFREALVIPTFYCEKRCKYCFYHKYTTDKQVLDVDLCIKRLNEAWEYVGANGFNGVNIGGAGDLSSLPANYVYSLLDAVTSWANEKLNNKHITVLTNLTNTELVASIHEKYDCNITVSLNKERPFNKETEAKLRSMSDSFRSKCILLSTVFPSMLKENVKELLDYYESFKVQAVTLNQYLNSVLAGKQYHVTNRQYCDFMISVYEEYKKGNYSFEITDLCQYETNLVYDRLTSADLIIDPYGKYQLISYTKDGWEQFFSFDNLKDWDACATKLIFETQKQQCLTCKYSYRCFSGMISEVKDDICYGFIPLIEYMNNE